MNRVPCPYGYPNDCSCNTCEGDRRSQRRARNREGGGRVARGVVAGAITLTGAYGQVTSTPQSGFAPLKDEADVAVRGERNQRARTQRGATRDKGNRTGGSGQGS